MTYFRSLLSTLFFLIAFSSFAQTPGLVWAKDFGPTVSLTSVEVLGVSFDASGNSYRVGTFAGTIDFDPAAAVTNLTSIGFIDIYVTKLDASGNLVWARQFGSTNEYNSARALTVDSNGNVIFMGYAGTPIDMDPGAGVSTVQYSRYAVKLNTNGNFVWAKSWPVFSPVGFEPKNLSTDALGNVLIVGAFNGLFDFNPDAAIANRSASGNKDIFILKLDATGAFMFAKTLGSIGNTFSNEGNAITADASGNIYAIGKFGNTVDFDPGTPVVNLTDQGTSDSFVIKLDLNGDFVWVKQFGGNPASRGQSTIQITDQDIEVDGQENILATGYFEGTANFDPGVTNTSITALGNFDYYMTKLNSSGNLLWSKAIGYAGFYNEYTWSATDIDGNIYNSGSTIPGLDLDPGSATFSLSGYGGYVSKLDASGNFVWAVKSGSPSGSGSMSSLNTFIDNSGSIYTAGNYVGNMDFDPDPCTYYLNQNIFIQKLSATLPRLCTIPTITSFTPSSGPVGSTVTITGTNFSTTPTNNEVKFNGELATVSISTATTITTTVPSGATTGVITVKVGTNTATSATDFTVTVPVPPVIISFTPSSGPIGTSVIITGTDFSTVSGDNEVRFNGQLASVSTSTATTIDTTVPTGATTGLITVKVGANTATSTTDFTVTLPLLPTITNFNPASGPINTAVTITGTNFSTTPGDNEVRFNGTLASVSFSTATSITTTVPSGASTGTITVKVGANTATSSSNFTVTDPPPAITSFTPTSGLIGTPVTIIGTNFSTTPGDNEVRFNGTLTTATSSTATSIDTTVPGGATTGVITVKVGSSTATSATNFVVTLPPPTIISFNPGSGFEGNTVVITGTNFSTTPSLNTVRFNGTAATVTTSTSTSITTIVPASATTGVITVRVGTNTATSSTDFVVTLPPPPTITSFTPGSGLIGTSVTIAGTNFSALPSNNELRFNGILASVISSTTTSITTTVPSGATTGVITVKVGANTATSATDFIVTLPPPPTITSFTPTLGPETTSVTITGTNFSSTASLNEVRFNGIIASVSSSTSTSIVTTVPSGATTGKITVMVEGNTATSATDFTVTHPPTITSFTPASGLIGTVVTITGTNFNTIPSANAVSFNGIAATVTSSTATTIVTEVPLNATTGPITVTVTDGTANSATDFTVIVPVITISTQPANATVCKGQNGLLSVTATGTTNITYQWGSYESSVFTPLSNDSDYSGVNTNTLTIATSSLSGTKVYRCQISGDYAASAFTNNASLIINAIPTAPTATSASGCQPSSSVALNAAGGTDGQYRWYANATGGTAITGEVNHSFITPAIASTTNYYVSVINNGCESTRTMATASILFCNQPPSIATTSKSISVEETATIDLLDLISDADNNIDPSSFKIVKQPLSGAPASINNAVLRINYSGVAFSGKDLLTIEACDTEGSCAQQEISIEVAGEVIVYNAVSPNGDGKNDFLFLQYIDIIQGTKENQVSILNRWGDVVFEIKNYNNADNVFTGLNKNGNELPSGTYFYKIQYASSRKSQTGYLYLKR